MIKRDQKYLLYSILISNTLVHYDTALYGFLIPILAPLFFLDQNKTLLLIKACAILSSGIIVRPLGSLFWGRLIIELSPIKVLIITLIGVTVSTVCIGVLPTYSTAGILSSFLLILLRMIQSFFLTGECEIASIYNFNYVKKDQYINISSYYNLTWILGYILASFGTMMVFLSPNPQFYWRALFILGALLGLGALFFRIISNKKMIAKIVILPKPISLLWNNKFLVIRIACLSSFNCLTYYLSFVFLNIFIPLVNDSITSVDMIHYNFYLLLFDGILLFFSGKILTWYTKKYNIEIHYQIMYYIVIIFVLTSIPIFYYLPYLSFKMLIFIRSWFVILGVIFSLFFPIALFYSTSGPEKYIITGVGYSIGSELFGRSMPAICLWLFYFLSSNIGPLIYIFFISIITLLSIRK